MKNNNKIYNLLGTLLIGVLFIISCTNNEGEDITSNTFDKSNIENAPLDKQIEYANKHLLDIGKIVVKLTHHQEFKSILYNNIQKKTERGFDNTVLVRDLIEDINAKSNGIVISEEDKKSLQNSLEAFYDLDGQDWHPEIIITNFETKYQKFLSSPNSKAYDESKPLIVPVVYEDDYENTEDAYIAYQEQADETLVAMDFLITESDAETRDIIFLKIAESCDIIEDDMKTEELSRCSGDGGSGGGGNSTSKFTLNSMTGKHHKEAIGRSEIEVKTQGRSITGHFPLTIANPSNTSRDISFSYKRRWIRRKTARTLNERYIYADPIPQGMYYDVLVFEWDSWPAPNKTQHFSKTLSNGEVYQTTLKYRSWQSPYNSETKQGVPTWTFENSGIKYNFKYIY